MTKRDIFTTIFMIAGIYVWMDGLQILAYLPFIFGSSLGNPSGLLDDGFWPFALPVICTALVAAVVFCVGFVLFFRASALALRAFPEGEGEATPLLGGTHDLHAIAISVVGLMLAVWALPGLVFHVLLVILPRLVVQLSDAGPDMSGTIWQCVEPLLKVAIGGTLFLKAGVVAEYWRSTQETTNAGESE